MRESAWKLCLTFLLIIWTQTISAKEIDITFFITSDTHYGVSSENLTNNLDTLDQMNAMQGTAYPATIGGTVDMPRGVVVTGDLTERGSQQEWDQFTAHYGVNGEGRISYPVYEGWGNHDGADGPGIVQNGIAQRNQTRPGLANISPNGYHYSWDWDGVHFIHLNDYPGTGEGDPTSWGSPKDNLPFLEQDLSAAIGNSDRPVIIFLHRPFDGWGLGNWTAAEQEAFNEAITPYKSNIIAMFTGHGHVFMEGTWNGVKWYQTAGAAGDGDDGFSVVRITSDKMVVANRQRATSSWGNVFVQTLSLSDPELTFLGVSDIHYGYTYGIQYGQANIDRMNALPGTSYPAALGGTVGMPIGVVMSGDASDNDSTTQIDAYAADWGVNGEGRLNYPLYDTWGNHDGANMRNLVISRNQNRATPVNVSPNGLHYSFDWKGVHFACLGIWPGNTRSDGSSYDPMYSLNFLENDLYTNVGNTGKPVVLYHHFGFGSHSLAPENWWTNEAAQAYYNVIRNFNVILILHGHEHEHHVGQWEGIDYVDLPHYDDVETDGNGCGVFRIIGNELSLSFYNSAGWGETFQKTFSYSGQIVARMKLVDLEAQELSEGPLSSWTNTGSKGGAFTSGGTNPVVERVAGVKAVTFDGADRMVSDFTAPQVLGDDNPFTIAVWAYNPTVGINESLVSWCDRKDSPTNGQYGAFGWGTDTAEGTAYYRYGTDLAYAAVPSSGQWHHIALTYSGGDGDSTLRVYVDGVPDNSVAITGMDGQFGYPIVLGAMKWTGGSPEWTNPFSGSLASLKIFNSALEASDIADLAAIKPPALLVDLEASGLTAGPLASWSNQGSLGGSFSNGGTTPIVEDIAGKRAVTFDGSDRMISDFLAPQEIGDANPFSIAVWAYNPAVGNNENMVAWCDRNESTANGQYGAFGWGTNTAEGAAYYRYGDDLAYANVPSVGQWHHLTLTYSGSNDDSILRVYVNGALDNSVAISGMDLQHGYPITLGAMLWTAHVPEWFNPFSGSLASVQIYNYKLSDEAVAQLGDVFAPMPDPAAWAVVPFAENERAITMTAAKGSDASGPIEYYFDEIGGRPGGTDSGWQTSPIYTDTRLTAGTEYTYTVTMRDRLGNIGSPSVPQSATTMADDGVPNFISINIGVNGALTPTEAAGVFDTANWNDFTGIDAPSSSSLIDDAGVLTGMFFSVTGQSHSFNSLGTSDKKMMSGWTQQPMTVRLRDIPFQTYDLVVYYDSWASQENNLSSVMKYALSSDGKSVSTVYAVNKKDFRFESNTEPDWDHFIAYSLEEANEEAATGDGGFHMVIPGLTQADLDITVSDVSGTPAGMSGIQIKEVPSGPQFDSVADLDIDGDVDLDDFSLLFADWLDSNSL